MSEHANSNGEDRGVQADHAGEPAVAGAGDAQAGSLGAVRAAVPTPPITAATFASFDSNEAFDLVRGQLEAYPDAKALKINTDIGFAIQNGMYAVKALEPLIPVMQPFSPNYDLTIIRTLRTLLLALNYLQTKHFAIQEQPTDNPDVAWLLERRARYKEFVLPLLREKVIQPEELNALKQGNGHHATAYAVLTLVDILLTHIDYVPSKLVSKESLLEARSKANELFEQLGTQQFGPDAKNTIKILRRKAFALVVETWQRLYAFVFFARHEFGDVDELMPTLFPKTGPRKSKPGKPSAPPPANPSANSTTDLDDEDFDSAPGVVATGSTAATNAVTNAAKKAAGEAPLDLEALDLAALNQRANPTGETRPGFPGGDPFRSASEEEEPQAK